MNNRLLVLSRYSRMGASSRLRTLQYQPWLQSNGFDVEYAALFDDQYLQNLYASKSARTNYLKYFLGRFSKIRNKPLPELIWVEKEAFPWMPWLLERSVFPRSVKIVSDFDDAIFHRYDLHRFRAVRRLLGRKIDRVMRYSNLVTAGNDYLAARARRAGARKVEIVPTVVDLSQYSMSQSPRISDVPQVGWIGTPNTWDVFGRHLHQQLSNTLEIQNARFKAVGASLEERSSGTLDCVPWSEETEVESIQSMDIGVMPLTDTPWSLGKCGYKLIQYMACGLPVVATPVGANKEIVEHGVNGFLANNEQEWNAAIQSLISNPELRLRMGRAGRKKVENCYSLQVWGPRVASFLANANLRNEV